MNRTFLLIISIITLLGGCICDAGCEHFEVERLSINKSQWNYHTTEWVDMKIGFFTYNTESKKKAFCSGYRKSSCIGSSIRIIPDSTKVLCNKTLRKGNSVFPANTNLLTYSNINQHISVPDNINYNYSGAYQLNLNELNFSASDLTTPYILTIQILTDKGIYADTTILTFQP